MTVTDSWRNQPRHPRGTEEGGRWVETLSGRIRAIKLNNQGRVPGRDLTKWVLARTRMLPQIENRQDDNALGKDWQRDHVLAAIAKEQGWDALPETVSPRELDQLISERGAIEIFRGVRGTPDKRPVWEWGPDIGQPAGTWHVDQTPRAAFQRLRESPVVQYGLGIWGNGLYFTVRANVARTYGNVVVDPHGYPHPEPGSVQRAALRPDARVVGYQELLDHWPGSKDRTRPLRLDASPEEPDWYGDPRTADKRLPAVIARDMGRYAAMLGYDAIRVENASDGYGRQPNGRYADQYVVLNRTALVFEEMRGVTDDAGA